jgi:Spy/CpxP family protein refolding chaperone
MMCLALGLGVLGFMAMRKARRCHHAHGCGYGGWHHHHGGWYGNSWGRRGLYMALARLEASPAQERAIIAEVDKLRDRLHAARSSVRDARPDLAAAVRGPSMDDAALGAVLGRVDNATAEARGAVMDALRNIHGLLDDRQRQQVADLIDNGWWRRGGGSPYRV